MPIHHRFAPVWLGLFASSWLGWVYPVTAQQVVPDATLGAGNNSITNTIGNRTDITGGLQRNSALFHSFERFSINTGTQVYFANPADVRNIFSRVTGGSFSNIDGVLGVSGLANLYLMNPNGIIFGPNARLDVSGSFFATTATVLEFPDGQRFAATGDRAVPLVEVNIPLGLQLGQDAPAMITNRGNLATGGNLTLTANNLDLQGQLQAGGHLTLNATDTVKIRDTVTEPFVARSGGEMTIQGNQGIDILTLNHLDTTSFISGGHFRLISDGIISGDAHFYSGGTFTINSLSGQPANFLSLYDPIISSNGDIDITGNYSGAALLVESLGNIRFGGSITITGNDPAFAGNPDPDLALLGSSAALILRANRTALAFAPNVPPATVLNGATFQSGAVPVGITIASDISTTDGLVILSTTGPVNIGNTPWAPGVPGNSILAQQVSIDTPSDVVITGGINARQTTPGPAGNVRIGSPAQPTNSVTVGIISARNSSIGNGGDISVNTAGNFTTTGAFALDGTGYRTPNPVVNPAGIVSLASEASDGASGSISITAGGVINLSAGISSASNFEGKGGGITLTGSAINTAQGVITSRNDNAALTMGTGGNVALTATTRDLTAGSIIASGRNSTDSNFTRISLTANLGSVLLDRVRLSTTNLGSRDAGDVFINADQEIRITNSSNQSLAPVDLGVTPNTLGIESEGTFGRILMGNLSSVDRVIIQNSSLSAQVLSQHTVGPTPSRIGITAGDIQIDNSSLTTRTASTAVNAGDITLTAQTGEVAITNNSQLTSTSIPGAGNAANLNLSNINIQGASVRIEGFSGIDASTAGVGQGGAVSLITTGGGAVTIDSSSVRSTVGTTATGNGGDIQVTAGQVTLRNGAALNTSNQSTGCGIAGVPCANPVVTTGGSVSVNATGAVALLNNSNIRTSVDLGSVGNGGNIMVAGDSSLVVSEGSRLSAQTSGTLNPGQNNARAGNITVDVTGAIDVAGSSPAGLSSGIFTSTDQPNSGQGGNITLQATGTLQVRDRAVINARTQSTANGGDIDVTVDRLEATNGGQLTTASSSTGTAGTITVTAPNGILLSGIAPAPTVVSPFSGITLQALTGFSTVANADIELDTTIPHVTLAVAGDGSFPYFVFAVTAAGSQGIFDIDNGIKTPSDPITNIDTELFLFNRDTGELLASNDDQSTTFGAGGSTSSLDAYINYTFANPGNYVIGVGRFNSFASNSSLIQGNSPQSGQTFTLQVSVENQGTVSDPIVPQSLNSGLFAQADGLGNAGNVVINTPQLTIEDGGRIVASTTSGTSGDIRVQGGGTGQVSLTGGAQVLASNVSGTGGSIQLAGLSTLQVNDSLIAASTTGNGGSAGSVTVNATDAVIINNGELSTQATAGNGTSGQVAVTTGQLLLQNASTITAATDAGVGNNIVLSGLNTLQVSNGSSISATTQTGRAGNLTVNDPSNPATTVALDASSLTVQANQPGGTAGSVTLNARSLDLQNNSEISAANFDAPNNPGDGDIRFTGLNHLTVSDSQISAATEMGVAGGVTIEATQGSDAIVTLTNNSTVEATANAGGNAGGVRITTPTLTVSNGATVAASSNAGAGTAGDVEIAATTVSLDNGSIEARTDQGGTAATAANVNLTGLNRLTASNSSSISASTNGGVAGTVTLTATQGTDPAITLTDNSVVSAAADQGGDAGGVSITTPTLALSDGAAIAVSSSNGNGTAGSIALRASTISLSNAAIFAETDGGGATNPANIGLQQVQTLTATDSQISSSTNRGRAGNVTIDVTNSTILSNSTFSVAATGGGTAGNLGLTTSLFRAFNNSEISVSSPTGLAGNLTLTAADFRLDRSALSAQTGGIGNGANIAVTVFQSPLLMRNGSLISANATGSATGGNITLNTPFLIALPFENSDIQANAVAGNGGQISITTQAIIGLKFRPMLTPLSDITASSESGNSGTVSVLLLSATDPTKESTNLPTNLVNVSSQAKQSCAAGGQAPGEGGRFTIAGRGGVTPSPTVFLPAVSTPSDWVSLEVTSPLAVDKVPAALGDPILSRRNQGQFGSSTCANAWTSQQQLLP